jgi:hypothetical protein
VTAVVVDYGEKKEEEESESDSEEEEESESDSEEDEEESESDSEEEEESDEKCKQLNSNKKHEKWLRDKEKRSISEKWLQDTLIKEDELDFKPMISDDNIRNLIHNQISFTQQ